MREKLEQRWVSLSDALRSQVKNFVVQTIMNGTGKTRHVAAQVVAKIGGIEVPRNMWPELLDALVNTIREGVDVDAESALLTALGYLGEELDERYVEQDQINRILEVVVGGLQEEKPMSIRRAAIAALNNMLEFVNANFAEGRESERDSIIGAICLSAECPDHDCRLVAFEAIANLAALHYVHIGSWIERLYTLTSAAVERCESERDVALMSLEFWMQVAETELKIAEGEEEGPCLDIIKDAADYVIPMFCNLLTMHDPDEDPDEDEEEPIPVMASGCLRLVCLIEKSRVMDRVMGFVMENFNHSDWRIREAATMALGCIVEGTESEPEALAPKLGEAFGPLMQRLSPGETMESHPHVRDTTAWVVANIILYHFRAIDAGLFEPTVQCLQTALDDVPRVASEITFCLHNLAISAKDAGSMESNAFSPYVGSTLNALLRAYDRADSDKKNLRVGVHEAIGGIIEHCPDDCLGVLDDFLPHMLQRTRQSFGIHAATETQRNVKDAVLVRPFLSIICFF